MDRSNFEFVLDIFKTLSAELPEQMLYRENGDSIELRTVDSMYDSRSMADQNDGWRLVGCRMVEAA